MVTETNLLTKVNFSDIPTTMPSEWYLGAFIPNGALVIDHVQARVRPVGGYWQQWEVVDAWNNTTRTATYSKPIPIEQVEFRRATPRYHAYLDPMDRTSRVSEKNFHANADQGLFVAVEWAAQYGIDAYALELAEPGDGPNELGLVQQTQNHWGPDANFAKTTWDFQFAGGYIDRAHVRAQALLPSGWTQLDIDPSENDPGDPSNAPFRFIGDYQLRLDLSTLAGPVTGLVIYRHTPRDVNVSVPLDAARIRATGMEPSARHAFFVAVEIGEELAKRVPPCECERFFTSLLYPTFVEDTVGFGPMVISDGQIIKQPEDEMQFGPVAFQDGGTLVSVLTFIDYTNQRDINPETMQFGPVAFLAGGTLVATITYLDYTNQRDVAPDTVSFGPSGFSSGTLVVIISYLEYTYQRDVNPDTVSFGPPAIQSGTLV